MSRHDLENFRVELVEGEPVEFKIHEVREQIAFLEREAGHDITEANLSLERTITNEAKRRVTFLFKLDSTKATELFGYPTFYDFMNEPYNNPPRYEIDRTHCKSDDPEDFLSSETIAANVEGKWCTVDRKYGQETT